MRRALVLAGGGVAGIAWELGVLRGLRDTDAGAGGAGGVREPRPAGSMIATSSPMTP